MIPQKNIPTNCLLVTIDVKSLYTNIPNSEGISAVKAAYESYPEKSVATKVIITFLALILTDDDYVDKSIVFCHTLGKMIISFLRDKSITPDMPYI